MDEPPVQLDRQGPVATLWLNRPRQRNAFDERLIDSLTVALRQLDADDSVRVVVLAGRGEAFCAGADLDWMLRMSQQDGTANLADAARLAALLQALAGLGKPTVARVQGAALGGGTGLVAACDIAVAASDAVFGTTEVRLGLIPATISPYVIRAMGERAAHRYFLTAERFSAAEALRVGFVHEVVTADRLDAKVGELAQALVQAGPAAVKACKELVQGVGGRNITPLLIDRTVQNIADIRVSDEGREGIQAFLGKRRPDWLLKGE